MENVLLMFVYVLIGYLTFWSLVQRQVSKKYPEMRIFMGPIFLLFAWILRLKQNRISMLKQGRLFRIDSSWFPGADDIAFTGPQAVDAPLEQRHYDVPVFLGYKWYKCISAYYKKTNVVFSVFEAWVYPQKSRSIVILFSRNTPYLLRWQLSWALLIKALRY